MNLSLRKFGVEDSERRPFLQAAATLFCVGWAEVTLTNAAEVLFIKRIGVDALPIAFIATAAVLAASSWAIGRSSVGKDRVRRVPRLFAWLAISLAPVWWLATTGGVAAYGLLMIAPKVLAGTATMLFWMAASDILDARAAKRLFAPLTAGMTLGGVVGSLVSRPLADWIEIEGLIPASAVAMGLAALFAAWFVAERSSLSPALDPRTDSRSQIGFAELLRTSTLFRLLALFSMVSGILGPMLYYEFQSIADRATASGEDELLYFYSSFRAFVGIAVVLVQLGLSSSLYRRLGLPIATAGAPILYGLGFASMALAPILPIAAVTLAMTRIQDHALTDPATKILTSILPDNRRRAAIAWIDGTLRRGGAVFGNLVVLGLVSISVPSARVAIPLALIWSLGAWRLQRSFTNLLLEAAGQNGTLRATDSDLRALVGRATVVELRHELLGSNPERSRIARELIAQTGTAHGCAALAKTLLEVDPVARHPLVLALRDSIEAIRDEAIRSRRTCQHLAVCLDQSSLFEARDRRTLLRAYARLLPPNAPSTLLERFENDSDQGLQLIAAVALHLRRGGNSEMLTVEIESALGASDPRIRASAQESLRILLLRRASDVMWGRWRTRLAQHGANNAAELPAVLSSFQQLALHFGPIAREPLLDSAIEEAPLDEASIAATLRYRGLTGQAAHAPWMVEYLTGTDLPLRRAAQDALIGLGAGATDALLHALSYGRRSSRLALLEVLSEIPAPRATLEELEASEFESAREDLGRWRVIRHRPDLALLVRRLEERTEERFHRVLLYRASILGEPRIRELAESLRRTIRGSRRRTVLIEGLENVFGADQAELIRYLEARSFHGCSDLGVRPPEGDEPDAILAGLRADREGLTRDLARALPLADRSHLPDHVPVKSIEKTLHLQAIPLFEGLSTRDLIGVAGCVRETSFARGEEIVEEGASDDSLFIVLEGAVEVRRGETGLGQIGPGAHFGEIALLEGAPRSANVVALEKTRVLALERNDFLAIVEEMPSIGLVLMRNLSKRVRELTERVAQPADRRDSLLVRPTS